MASAAAAAVVFRRRPDGSGWHFCENCSTWPDTPEKFEESTDGPGPDAGYCAECLELRKTGNCRLRIGGAGFSQ